MGAENTISDKALVERARKGDEAAFDALVERHAARAYRVAYGILGNREDSEEVAQDVFVRIHRSLKEFRGDSEFTTWMYRIAVNLANNKYRWNKSRGERVKVSMDAPQEFEDGDAEQMELPDDAAGPAEASVASERQQRLERELARIPAVYRTPLLMYTVDDVNYEEIAAALGCKVGTVKSRINRGRTMLRERMDMQEKR